MNETEYYDSQFREFYEVYSGSGLEILQESFTNGGIATYEVYRFLKNKHPEAINSKDVTPVIWIHERREKGGGYIPSIKENNVLGFLDIVWKGKRIVIREVRVNFGTFFTTRAILAVQDRNALIDLINEVQCYNKAEMRTKRRITVINGRDVPIEAASWEDLILPQVLKESIRSSVDTFFKSRELYNKMKVQYRRGILFLGPPGCGKTLTIKTIAANVEYPIITLQMKSDLSELAISEAIDRANILGPAILVFEDLDRLFTSSRVSLPYFLNLLDGFGSKDGVLIIGTGNDAEAFDGALIRRPSRFDRVWEFPLPDFEARLIMLKIRGGDFFSEAALEKCAQETQGLTLAFVQEIVVSALLSAAHKNVTPNEGLLIESLNEIIAQHRAYKGTHLVSKHTGNLGFTPK